MRQVVVTDVAGKVVYDARPAEGQRTVKIDSYRLGPRTQRGEREARRRKR